MKRFFAVFLCLAFLATCSSSLYGCAKLPSNEGFTIVATMFPQYDFAREIAGDRANVELLLDFGADAHSYDPTPEDVMKIARADLFIYTGDDMELWAKKLLECEDVSRAISSGSLRVLDLSKYVSLLDMHEHDHGEGVSAHEHDHDCEYDTHIWTSVSNAGLMCDAITDAICDIDADGEAYYRANLANYKEQLLGLATDFSNLCVGARLDEAFFGGSFAFRYMFEELQIGYHSIFEGCSSHAEASAADIISLSDEIKATGAKYVLYDSPSEKKIADAVAAECGVEVLHLHAIHNITKAEFESGETYISLMRKNIETLGKALS